MVLYRSKYFTSIRRKTDNERKRILMLFHADSEAGYTGDDFDMWECEHGYLFDTEEAADGCECDSEDDDTW